MHVGDCYIVDSSADCAERSCVVKKGERARVNGGVGQ